MLGVVRRQLLAGGAPAHPLGVLFDGSNDYMLRGSDLTGNADGKKGIVSTWFRMTGGDGAAQILYSATGGLVGITRSAANKIAVAGFDTTPTLRLSMSTVATYTAGPSWHHLLAAWDLGAGYGQIYVDDNIDLAASPTLSNAALDYTQTNHAIGASTTGTSKLNAELADFWLDFGTTLDFTQTNVRRQFISAARRPMRIGADGELPLGRVPTIFLKGPASGFNTNHGSGGDFTVTGALTDAAAGPGD